MLHRRCEIDDGYGVDEALNEDDRVQIKMWLLIETSEFSIVPTRKLSILLNHPTSNFYSLFEKNWSGNISKINYKYRVFTTQTVSS